MGSRISAAGLPQGLKVAYVYPRSDTMGGAPIHVRDMTRRLLDEGHEAKVFIGGDGPFLENLEAHGVPYESLRFLQRAPHPVADLRAIFELYGVLKAYQPDLISTHCAKAGFVGRIVGRLLKIPTVYTPHCWPFAAGAPNARLYHFLEKLVVPVTKRIFLVADAEGDEAFESGLCSRELMQTIHNGMLDVEPEFRGQADAEPPRLFMVARFEPQKDHATLFEALADLRDLDWSLDLVGGGPLQEVYEQKAVDLGLAERIRFHGHSTRVKELLAEAQIFLLIANWEGFPRSTLEGMRAGLPVVVSDVGGSREALVDGGEGFVVPRGDAVELARVLRELISRPELRAEMGRQSRQTYEASFTFDRMYERYLRAYGELLEG